MVNNAKIAFWNPWSYSNERHEYCKSLGYDIIGLTELHNNQAKPQFEGKRWICSELAEEVNDKSTDPAAGVVIMLSARMADKVMSEGHVGTRIAWVRIKGPVCNIFFIVVYIPHKGATTAEAEGSRHDRATEEPATVNPQIRLCGTRRRFQLSTTTECA